MTVALLALVLFAALAAVGGRRGFRTMLTLLVNGGVFILLAKAILDGMNPVAAAVLAYVAICVLTLFFNSGVNAKSIASFTSVICVVLLLWILVGVVGRGARVEGFSFQKLTEIAGYSWIINISMGDVAVACILVGMIGAVSDTSIAVSSAAFEVAQNNPDIDFSGLFASGMRIGRDILGTTCNTLYFAFLGGYMTLLIWFNIYAYSFSTVINAAVFAEEFLRVMTSALGCVLIVPVTALFTALLLRTRANCIIIHTDALRARVTQALEREPYPDSDADFDDEDKNIPQKSTENCKKPSKR